MAPARTLHVYKVPVRIYFRPTKTEGKKFCDHNASGWNFLPKRYWLNRNKSYSYGSYCLFTIIFFNIWEFPQIFGLILKEIPFFFLFSFSFSLFPQLPKSSATDSCAGCIFLQVCSSATIYAHIMRHNGHHNMDGLDFTMVQCSAHTNYSMLHVLQYAISTLYYKHGQFVGTIVHAFLLYKHQSLKLPDFVGIFFFPKVHDVKFSKVEDKSSKWFVSLSCCV